MEDTDLANIKKHAYKKFNTWLVKEKNMYITQIYNHNARLCSLLSQ